MGKNTQTDNIKSHVISGSSIGMTIDDYASWKGTSSTAVAEALKNGQLTKSIDGLIDPNHPPIGLTQAEYARHREAAGLRGGTRQMVAKAASSGWLTYHVDGTIDQEASDSSWSENATVRIDNDRQNTSPAQSIKPKSNPDTPDINDSRAEAEYHKARKWKHEADLIEGRVIDKYKAKAAFDEIFRLVQQRVMNIPDRTAAMLAGITDEKEIHRILSDECHLALSNSADSIVQRLELDRETIDAVD